MPDFRTAEERSKYITDRADYFTCVTFLGRGKYERHEIKGSLEDARSKAQNLANEAERIYGVYAVMGAADTWVCNIHPRKKAKL